MRRCLAWPRATPCSLSSLCRATAGAESALPRVVSLNPSLTAILLALDARPALVGVDDYSARAQPRARGVAARRRALRPEPRGDRRARAGPRGAGAERRATRSARASRGARQRGARAREHHARAGARLDRDARRAGRTRGAGARARRGDPARVRRGGSGRARGRRARGAGAAARATASWSDAAATSTRCCGPPVRATWPPSSQSRTRASTSSG